MVDTRDAAENGCSTAIQPPFLYEIRVKGRLSQEQWTSWFDDLTVTTRRGETLLRGRVPDHAALYALLARLRDLAIPLVSVKVLDAEAQRKLNLWNRRYDLAITLVMIAIYALLLGGLSAITVFVAPIINTALALALLFALLGGLAHAFYLWSGQRPWHWFGHMMWPAALIAFLVYIPVSGFLPPAIGIAIMLILAAGVLVYVLYELRRRAERVKGTLVGQDQPSGSPGTKGEPPAGGASRQASPKD